MNEPLICWVSMVIFLTWGHFSSGKNIQTMIERGLGKYAPLVQWYNWSFLLLCLLFLRTFYDVIVFEYWKDHFLSWDQYKGDLDVSVTNIPLSAEELNFQTGPLVIPPPIRWISLFSPIAGLLAFGIAARQIIIYTQRPMQEWDAFYVRFLHMVVVGMPLIFIVMSMRATIRQWAVMTGSAWLPYSHLNLSHDEAVEQWAEVKAAEQSTWTQDLEVAMGFQFFAIWSFGQVCSDSLRKMFREEEAESRGVMMQLGILGLHAFVAIGLVKAILSVALAILSANPHNEAMLMPLQKAFEEKVGPMFIFATALAMANMFFLGKVSAVKEAVPKTNKKFMATRILLLIGQGQMTVLHMATNDHGQKSKLIEYIHRIPWEPLHSLQWTFNANQARLLHSSLLCYECLVIVMVNYLFWHQSESTAAARECKEQKGKLQPLLPS
mmetsp:Transcript_57897/g.130537  ORF Transcript_57897/g.130537 Transcript_57897/m.130537 type:complete len:437 (-) Transcript_57897:226-1536(-)